MYYKDIKKSDKYKNDSIPVHYNMLGKKIVINNSRKLVSNKKYIELDKGEFDIVYQDNKKYYVMFLDRVYELNKSKNDKVTGNDFEIKNIPVLIHNKISDVCGDYNCTTTASFREQINKLSEDGYYFISTDEFNNYKNRYINLKDKAIMIQIKEESDTSNSIKNELKIDINKNEVLENTKVYELKSYSKTDNVLKMANLEDVVEEEPKVVKTKQGVPVLNYHFFYDPTLGESCNEGICLTVQKFREHLQYLKDNGYTTLTIDQFTKWMYGEIDVPDKSVLITIDDGAMGTGAHNGNKLIPLLEEYKMHATLFLIACWWKIDNYRSDYLDIQSHTYDMHQYGTCGKGQLVCANYDEVKADLQMSLDIIGNKNTFCYPFYSYDNEAIQAIKDLGFKLAFAGGNRNATRSSNKYTVPRYPIQSSITMARFKEIVG